MSKVLSVIGVAAVVALMAPAPASAMTYEKLTYLTFSAPVQVPGATLNAGTYRFRLANPDTGRKVLQVLSNDGTVVHAMFLTTDDFRAKATKDSVLTFRETPAGVPAAAKSLFYNGERNGYEFVYPKGFPIMTAPLVPQPEITYTSEPVAAAPEPVPEPEVAPEPVAEVAPEPAPVEAPAPVAEPQAPPELPKTATPLPLVAVGGFVTLLAGLGLGLLRKAVN